jgi:hypothetical protein
MTIDRKPCGGGELMGLHHHIVNRVLCVALVVALMFPVGRMLFPLIAQEIGTTPFGTIEAVVSTTLGFALYAALFG